MTYTQNNNLSPSQSCFPGDKDNKTTDYMLTRVEDRTVQNGHENELNDVFYIDHINIGTLSDFGINPTYKNYVNVDFAKFITAIHENFVFLNNAISNSGTPSEPDTPSEPNTPQDSNYYYYVGLTQPDSSTVISNTVGKGQQGWHLIGDTLSGYSLANPIYNGGNPTDCINLNENYDDVDYYIALPDGVCLRDGSGTDHSSEYLIQSGVTINSRTYNIFKDHFSDFMFIVY